MNTYLTVRGGSSMASIEIKRAYERPAPKDGKRILIDRLWPRGLRKEVAALDLWCCAKNRARPGNFGIRIGAKLHVAGTPPLLDRSW
jgi:hypothetical protein